MTDLEPSERRRIERRRALIDHIVNDHGGDETYNPRWPDLNILRAKHTEAHRIPLPRSAVDDLGSCGHEHSGKEPWTQL